MRLHVLILLCMLALAGCGTPAVSEATATIAPVQPIATEPAESSSHPAIQARGAFFALSVADLEASQQWYQESLGLEVTLQQSSPGAGVAVLEGGGLMVELIKMDGSQPLGQDPTQVHGFFKAGVVVADLDAVLAYLRERGVAITFGPYPATAEQRANFIIQDNAGNLIQFFGE